MNWYNERTAKFIKNVIDLAKNDEVQISEVESAIKEIGNMCRRCRQMERDEIDTKCFYGLTVKFFES